jgi:type IV pilus assembly protein PilY1
VAEAQIKGVWKTVLASGMGGGAQGVFALDVTDPANFESGGKALFEFTDADDADMGNVVGVPVIAKFRTGVTNGTSDYKYFAVVASGLNNYKDDGEKRFNTDAAGSLFLLSLDKGPSVAWKEGVNYFKIRIPSADAALQNGLGAPALVLGPAGAVRYVYAGDLQGNLWRFDFSDTSMWSNLSSAVKQVFVARDGQGVRQPITMQPRVVFAPGGGYIVLFGTGKFLEEADAAPGNFSVQSFYGILDTTAGGYSVAGRSELTLRLLEKSGNGFKVSGEAVPYGTKSAGSKGWYLDFFDSAKTGERSVTNPLTTSGYLFFNSLIPAINPCDGGGGRTYVLDTLNGLPSNSITGLLSTIGMLSSPVPFETGTEVGDRNAVGRRAVKKKYTVVNFGTSVKKDGANTSVSESIEAHPPAGRFSWREILNWQELRNAYSKK